jgi:zinc protease
MQPAAAAVLATALTAALLSAANPASAVARTAVVDVGGAHAYVRSDANASLAGVELFVRAGLDRQSAAQNGLAALVAESVLRTPIDAASPAVSLTDAVSARGGSLAYAVSSQYVRFYLEAPPDVLPALTPLVARALAAPSFDAPVLAAARTALAERIALDESDPRQVGLDMLRASYYRDGAGLPLLGTTSSLAAFAPQDAHAFFARWYLRGDAFVTAVGRTGESTDAAARALVGALPAGSAPAPALGTRTYGAQPKRIVTHRDVFAPYVVLAFRAPALGERDFAAALVVRAVLSDVFDRRSATTRPPLLRAVGAIYGYDVAPAQLVLWINGARIDPSVGVAAVDAVLKKAATKPLAPAVLSRYKDAARGQWALEALSLDERAFWIGNAVAHGLDADAAEDAGAAIGRVTAADVQRVVKDYFQRFEVALVLPRGTGG